MEELKFCPFCPPEKSDPRLIHYDTLILYLKFCTCGAMSGRVEMTKERAIQNWNTRAERTCHWDENPDGSWHAECAHRVDWSGALPDFCPGCGAKVERCA